MTNESSQFHVTMWMLFFLPWSIKAEEVDASFVSFRLRIVR